MYIRTAPPFQSGRSQFLHYKHLIPSVLNHPLSGSNLGRDARPRFAKMTSRVGARSLFIFVLTGFACQAALISTPHPSQLAEIMSPKSLFKSPLKFFSPSDSSTPSKKAGTTTGSSPFWMEKIKHQGISPFNPSPKTYKVFRNVKVSYLLNYALLVNESNASDA